MPTLHKLISDSVCDSQATNCPQFGFISTVWLSKSWSPQKSSGKKNK